MWIMIILLMVLNAMYAFGILKVFSDADDQIKRLVIEYKKDGQNG